MTETTLKNLSVFGNTAEAKIAKSGTPHVKCAAVERDEDGNIAIFLKLCFFPEANKVVKLRDKLCQGDALNDTAMSNVNPLKGKAKYMALELCGDVFRYSEYKKMLDLVRKKDTNDKTVAQYLKQLITEKFVDKDSNKNYKKRWK